MQRREEKTGYIIYEREEAEKNRWFIEKFRKEGEEAGLFIQFVPKDQFQSMELPEFILNRTRDPGVSRWYEDRKVPAVHSSALVETGNHKWKTYEYLRAHWRGGNLQIPQTISFPCFSKEKFERWMAESGHQKEFAFLQDRFVLKTVDGHGGAEVFCFNHFSAETAQIPEMLLGRDCILQEQVDSDAMDVRVYILGNEIYQGILRKGQGDFRSNFSLGGKTERYVFSETEKAEIRRYIDAISGLSPGMAGLDFIVKRDGSLVFNELEEMVGCRMLYAETNLDIVKDYVRWLGEKFCL